MAKALYMDDCYLKEFEAVVKNVTKGKFVVLDRTAFYPNSGGQPYDTGVMIRQSDKKQFIVVYVGKFDGEISHEVGEEGLQIGDKVIGKINWERRYKLMRSHTAAHVLSAIFHKEILSNLFMNFIYYLYRIYSCKISPINEVTGYCKFNLTNIENLLSI